MNDTGMDLSDPTQLRDHLKQLFADPTLFPDVFTSWLPNYLASNPPDLNIDQINGFQQYAATAATIIQAEESTTSVVYTNLTTTGPTVSGLSDGLYEITYNASAKISSAATRAKMNLSINGAAPSDTATPQAYTSNTGGMVGVSGFALVRLSGGVSGNTVTLQYAVGATASPAPNGTWGGRSLTVKRVSN